MIKKHTKLLILAMSALLVLAVFAACDSKEPEESTTPPCTQHTDGNSDGKCDSCGAEVEAETCDHIDTDGDNICEICDGEIAEPVEFDITILDENKAPIQGITVIIDHEIQDTVTAVTDENGRISATTLPEKYFLSFEGLPDGWYIEGTGKTLNISEDNKSFKFTAIDNNPDGTEKKPYFVGDDAVEKTFAAGTSYYYSAKGSSKYLIVNNENAKVTYDGAEYLPEGGVIRVKIADTDTNSTTLFMVTNTASGENTIVVEFESLPGSQGNPFTAQLDKLLSTTVPAETTHYYTWTATDSGFLVLESDTESNYIMMYDLTSSVVTGYTNGAKSVCLRVNKGDDVLIYVASNSPAAESLVEFKLDLVSGTQDDPIPVYSTGSVRASANASFYLVYHGEDKTMSIPQSGLQIFNNGTEVDPVDGYCRFTVSEGSLIFLKIEGEGITEIQYSIS